ncbi:MAG: PH domain-containing protein [Planctomycetota bacterium]
MNARTEEVIATAHFENATKYFVVSNAVVLACTIVGIPLMLIVLPIVWIAKTIEYKHISCELHTRSLKVKRGWINKSESSVPLDKITDLAVKQGPIMRWCGVEALSVETAGQTSGGMGALVQLVGVRDARTFRDTVLARRDALAEGAGTAQISQGTPAGPAGSEAGVLHEIRDALLRIEARIGQDS